MVNIFLKLPLPSSVSPMVLAAHILGWGPLTDAGPPGQQDAIFCQGAGKSSRGWENVLPLEASCECPRMCGNSPGVVYKGQHPCGPISKPPASLSWGKSPPRGWCRKRNSWWCSEHRSPGRAGLCSLRKVKTWPACTQVLFLEQDQEATSWTRLDLGRLLDTCVQWPPAGSREDTQAVPEPTLGRVLPITLLPPVQPCAFLKVWSVA